METTSQTDRSGWWLAYFIVQALLYVAGLLLSAHSPLTVLISIFNGIALVGLWGYLADKAVGWRQFWVAYAYLMFMGAAVGLGPGLWQGVRDDFGLFVILAIAAVFSMPLWLAVWRYAFRSAHIWHAPTAAA